MKAVYILWSERDKIMTDYSAITGLLSMLYWKKNNGPVKLYADKNSMEFLNKYGFFDLGIIDEVDDVLLNNAESKLITNKDCHWTWGDIFAIGDIDEECVFMDFDNIYKQKYVPKSDADITLAHREGNVFPYYPHPKMFISDYNNSEFSQFDWDNLDYIYNVSFMHVKNIEFAKKFGYYGKKYLTDPNHQHKMNCDYLAVRAIFAIQTLLTAVIKKYNYSTDFLMNDVYYPEFLDGWTTLDGEKSNKDQDVMYHLWHAKKLLHTNHEEYYRYMNVMIGDLKRDFPEYFEPISKLLYPLSKWKTSFEYDYIGGQTMPHNTGVMIKYI